MDIMEPEALSFRASGDFGSPKDAFSVPQYAKTGPSDTANAGYAAQRSLSAVAQAQADNANQKAADDAQAAKVSAMQARARARARTPAPTPGALPTGLSSPFSGTGMSSRLGSLFDDTSNRLTFSQGTAQVPGHGSGHVDTVPAMLAPGEAVLNRAAAENFGRGNIAQLNAVGAHQMGLGMHGSDETMRRYAEGTPYVDPNAAWGSRPAAPPAPAPQPGYAAGFQPPPVMQPPSPNMRAMGIGVQPEMPFPQIDRGPQVGIPNRPARVPAGPPAPPRPVMDPTGWVDPGLAQRAQRAPSMAMPQPDMHVGWAPQGGAGDPNSMPMMHQMGLGMLLPSGPSLGGERARGGLSAFEQAFSAARKAGKSTFPYNGGSYNTKRADGR